MITQSISSSGSNTANSSGPERIEARAVSKILKRLVPLLILLSIFNYLDRTNIGFAKLQMNSQLGFSDAIYGFGASVFFIGYFLFEIPSNLVLRRVGSRIWIARIMITWGAVAAAMAFAKTPSTFYALRFLLGVAEAGFFPAILLYLGDWVPVTYRARVTAVFLTSLALSGIIGGPLAGAIMGINAVGVTGWQWLFLIEGAATVLLGVFVLIALPNRPQDVVWLDEDEKGAIAQRIAVEHATQAADAGHWTAVLKTPAIWTLSLVYGLLLFGFYAVNYFAPSIIKLASHASTAAVGWLSAIPYAAAMAAMLFVGRVADRREIPFSVVPVSLLVAAGGLIGAAKFSTTALTLAALAVATAGIYAALAPFWTVAPSLLRGTAAAVGIAAVNSIGNLGGGLIGPNVIGQLRIRNVSYSEGLMITAGVLVAAALFAFLLCRQIRPKPNNQPNSS